MRGALASHLELKWHGLRVFWGALLLGAIAGTEVGTDQGCSDVYCNLLGGMARDGVG